MSRCLMCSRQTRDRDCCVACEWLLRGDSLLRDAYRARGGTFAGLTNVGWQGGWTHGTETGWRHHRCPCEPCMAAHRRYLDRQRVRDRERHRERRAAA